MAYIFNMPDVGEGMSEGEIVSWHVAEGLSLIHISEPTRQDRPSRMPSSA